ncbi:MAG: hypothetical protein ACOCV2_14275, partial [Persicimonas sp.]
MRCARWVPLNAEYCSIDISCPGCNKRFRLRPAEGRSLPEEVPCPRCNTIIPVPEEDPGWERTEISTIFELPGGPARRPEDPPRAEPETEKERRAFKDVTAVERPSLGLAADGPGPGPEPEPEPEPGPEP